MTAVLEETAQTRFVELVRALSGMDLSGSRLQDLDRGISKALATAGVADVDALYELLCNPNGNRAALEVLISEVTVGETHFFRNRPQFGALEHRILPDVIARRWDERRLRVWSAGCSSGEEPYSLAILIKRLLPDLASWDVSILATDIDVSALAKARRGIYGQWSFREVPPEIEAGYFVRRDRKIEVIPGIRDMVTFEYLNLADDVYPSLLNGTVAMDLIVCRNVLIYFDEPNTRRVARGFYDVLADDGWLVVGPAEPSQSIFEDFQVRNFPRAIVYQKSSPEKGDLRIPSAKQISLTPPKAPPTRSKRAPRRIESPTRRRSEQPRPARNHSLRDEALERWAAGDHEHALRMLETLTADAPKDAETPYLIAKLHADRLELEPARRWVEIALTRDPLFAPAHYLQGLIFQEEDQSEAALGSLRRSVYADPSFALGQFALGGLLQKLGHPRRAATAFRNASRLLAGRDRSASVEGGDGLTVGRLLELVSVQKDLRP